MEEFFAHSEFAVSVAEQPVAVSGKRVVVFQYVFGNICAFETGVVEKVSVRYRRVPFCNINGEIVESFCKKPFFQRADEFAERVGVCAEE